jgi:hypothetical protein
MSTPPTTAVVDTMAIRTELAQVRTLHHPDEQLSKE